MADQPLNPVPNCLDLEQQPATPLLPNANSIRVYNSGGELAAINSSGESVIPAPAGNTGDFQFNDNGAFANAAEVNAACLATIDGGGNMTFAAAAGSLSFVANNQYSAGANTILLSAGGDTTLELDSTVNPETITLDSDLSGTEIFIGKSSGLVVKIGGPNASIGFFNATPVTKPTITGSKGGNAALASLITQLAALGIVTDSTT